MHESFLSQNIFCESKNIFCDYPVEMELENEKTESVNENKNKENKNVDEFQEYILQQKPAKTKANHKATWRRGMSYNKSFIDQASSVNIAGFRPRFLFAFLWTSIIYVSKDIEISHMTLIIICYAISWWITANQLAGRCFVLNAFISQFQINLS